MEVSMASCAQPCPSESPICSPDGPAAAACTGDSPTLAILANSHFLPPKPGQGGTLCASLATHTAPPSEFEFLSHFWTRWHL